jgi:hypothetical protein
MRLLALELLADEPQHVDHGDVTHGLRGHHDCLVLAHQIVLLQGVDLHDERGEELLLVAVGDGAAEALSEELVQVVGGVVPLFAREHVLVHGSAWQLRPFSSAGRRLGTGQHLLLQLLLLLLEQRLLLLPRLPFSLCRCVGHLRLRRPSACILLPRALVLGSLVATFIDPGNTIPGGLGLAPHRCRAAWARALRRTAPLLCRTGRLLCRRSLHFR